MIRFISVVLFSGFVIAAVPGTSAALNNEQLPLEPPDASLTCSVSCNGDKCNITCPPGKAEHCYCSQNGNTANCECK